MVEVNGSTATFLAVIFILATYYYFANEMNALCNESPYAPNSELGRLGMGMVNFFFLTPLILISVSAFFNQLILIPVMEKVRPESLYRIIDHQDYLLPLFFGSLVLATLWALTNLILKIIERVQKQNLHVQFPEDPETLRNQINGLRKELNRTEERYEQYFR